MTSLLDDIINFTSFKHCFEALNSLRDLTISVTTILIKFGDAFRQCRLIQKL